jgi:hypothetical protein
MINYEVKERKEDGQWEPTFVVTYDGEEVFVWCDSMHIDCPEDLTWNRTIAEVFEDGVKLGQRMMRDHIAKNDF